MMKPYISVEITLLSVAEEDILRTSVDLSDSGFGDIVEY